MVLNFCVVMINNLASFTAVFGQVGRKGGREEGREKGGGGVTHIPLTDFSSYVFPHFSFLVHLSLEGCDGHNRLAIHVQQVREGGREGEREGGRGGEK
jgi:hypothetical protein